MSYITLILIKNKKIQIITNHYREILNKLKNEVKPIKHLDGGYILIDIDSEIILDNQTCFSLSDIKNKEVKSIVKKGLILPGLCQTSRDI